MPTTDNKKITNADLLQEIREMRKDFTTELANEILKIKTEFEMKLQNAKEEM